MTPERWAQVDKIFHDFLDNESVPNWTEELKRRVPQSESPLELIP